MYTFKIYYTTPMKEVILASLRCSMTQCLEIWILELAFLSLNSGCVVYYTSYVRSGVFPKLFVPAFLICKVGIKRTWLF